jgi:predicted nucleic acid-binding protein
VTIVADTGPLYALVDASDAWHKRVVEWWRKNREPVVVPVCVLPEVCYLLHTRISQQAEAAFVRSITDGEFVIESLEAEDIARADALMRKYSDLELGFVDATVIATAERLDAIEVVTTDRRHFSAVRPRHVGAFRLSPVS